MQNREAIGYMLVACEKLNIDKNTAKKIMAEMYYQFDILTEEEADERGHDWINES